MSKIWTGSAKLGRPIRQIAHHVPDRDVHAVVEEMSTTLSVPLPPLDQDESTAEDSLFPFGIRTNVFGM